MIGKTMTPPRRQRKLRPVGFGLLLSVPAFTWLWVGGPIPIRAGTSEQVVVDRHTGLAISGFDPVAYFVEGAAAPGKGDFEYGFAGAVWRFRNEGNRAAFMTDPEVYMPRFGGYDPIGIVRGVGIPGHPQLWLVVAGRLYLSNTLESQAALVSDADRTIAAADRKWPSVRPTLSP